MHIVNLLDRGPLDYMEIDALQRYLHAEVATLKLPDTFIVWEAKDTYTAGRRTKDHDIPDDGVPVIRMDRGGSVTYHGPGQLVVYPIVKVRPPRDVVAFVRSTERALIDAVATLDIAAYQVPGRSGVWIAGADVATGIESKLCAIGIKFADDATMHGMALNVSTNLSRFERIVPCGIADASVTSLAELSQHLSLRQTAELITPVLIEAYTPFLLRPSNDAFTYTDTQIDEFFAKSRDHHGDLPLNTGTRWTPRAHTHGTESEPTPSREDYHGDR